jgi:hypothetical protein
MGAPRIAQLRDSTSRPRAGRGVAPTAGAAAASSWLSALGLQPPAALRWHVEIAISDLDGPPPIEFDERVATRFQLDLYSEEWGYFFCHHGRSSWIRVTDIPFVHGRDDFGLLVQTPTLGSIGAMIRTLEGRHAIQLRREHALVRTNLTGGEATVRRWLATL